MDFKTYVINLDEYPNKLNKTIYNLNSIGITNIEKIQAVDRFAAEKLSENYITYEAYKNIMNVKATTILPTWGAVGCAISHIKAWEKIMDSNDDFAFVCEDDIDIYNIIKAKYRMKHALHLYNKNKKQDDAIIILFNAECIYHTTNTDINSIQYIDKSLFKKTHFYLINKQACKYFKTNILPLTYQIDIELSKINAKTYSSTIKVYNIKNSGIDQLNDYESTVQYRYLKLNELLFIFYSKLPKSLINILYEYIPKAPEQNYYNNYINLMNVNIGMYYY